MHVPHKILICEDDPGILEVLTLALTEQGFEPVQHSSAKGIEEKVRKERPSLVLLDILIRGEKGTDLIQKIRSDSELSGTRIILMSANSSLPDIAKEHEVDYLTKPFGLEELWKVIERNTK